jgi:hypothetical protein
MTKLNSGLSLLLLAFTLTACESPSSTGSVGGDGRERLSVNDSDGDFGDYVVHVNAMTTSGLAPAVAKSYDITRSENTALVNLVVLKKSTDAGQDTPTRATVDLTAANLTGQLKPVALREIEEGASIYYIGEVRVDDQETINFDFDVLPEGEDRPLLVRFSHQFYTR